jgi:hypothetical protein
MSPPARQSVARISEDTGIHIATFYACRKGWRLEGEVVPASHKDPSSARITYPSPWLAVATEWTPA